MKSKLFILVLVSMVMMFAASAFGQADIGFKAVGVKAGLVKPEDVDGTIGFGAIVDLGIFAPQFGWEAEIAYWKKSESKNNVEASVRDIAILSSCKYSFPVPESQFIPFLGAGLGIHLGKFEVKQTQQFFGSQKQSKSETKFGFHILGGTEMKFSPEINGFAELRYCFVSDINQLWLMAGAKYYFPVK